MGTGDNKGLGKMKRIWISDRNERYPDHSVFDSEPLHNYNVSVRVKEETFREWQRIVKEYDKMQDRLARLFDREEEKRAAKSRTAKS